MRVRVITEAIRMNGLELTTYPISSAPWWKCPRLLRDALRVRRETGLTVSIAFAFYGKEDEEDLK